MRWTEWLDIDTLKILSFHASGVIGAILVFKIIGFFIGWGLKGGTLKTVVEAIDSIVLVGLFLWLAYQMGRLLWKKRTRNGPTAQILVA